MADSHAKMTQATPQEILISVLAGLFAPLLAIFLIVMLVLSIQAKHKPDTSSEAAQKATLERIKPFATLAALDANAPKVEKSGQEVFEAVCTTCHTPGALGAPKFQNKADWGPRIKQGYDTLIKHALEGIRQMPPRGGDGDLSDTEVARAVAYMANAAGADFKAPEAPAPAAAGKAADAGKTAAAPAKPDPAKGKAVFEGTCVACHGTGVAGAPKLGDKAAWGPRISQGYATLYDHALHGIRAMPAKGGNASLSEADVANAVAYLVTEGGGKL
ncbi:c-type cytochrome [Thiobacillus sedimenti]|uniref:C-type cytochrome n=1 Tax=Thiobacillus sedimenti TaxID=3110231 RepID=A0ABZ1CJN5_9PROT|nr:c-type cytochrome [Thiobacillus sp. SCUT-2]WRS39456.1 c-type cytochrome [Thiobacillus sp. SCUT-2]